MARFVLPLSASPAAIGAKAAGFARAKQIGLLTPRGFAISIEAFTEAVRRAGGPWSIPEEEPLGALERAQQALASVRLEGLELELGAAVAELGLAQLSVRSSATIEDQAHGSAAGVFASVTNVPAGGLLEAIRAVWASALGPAAYAYLRARGKSIADAKMGVLVHEYIEGAAGVLFTRDPSQPDAAEARIEVEAPWQPISVHVPRAHPDEAPAYRELVCAGLALERAAGDRALDVEWVRGKADGALYVLQQRPITALAPPAFSARPPDDAPWRFDAEHNPEPLSPAQQGLVARVAQGPGVRQCVIGGYLYGTHEGAAPPRARYAPADLPGLVERTLGPAMEAILAPLEAEPALPLEQALEGYDHLYAIYAGELGVSLSRARAALGQILRAHDLDPRLASDLLAGTPTETTARDEAIWRGDEATVRRRWGAMAPVWDVSCPTFAESPPEGPAAPRPDPSLSPERRRQAAATRGAALAQSLLAKLPRMARRALAELLPIARAVYAIGEADDLYFARAQWLVRRALLLRGPAPEIFFVPLGQPFDAKVAARGQAEQTRQKGEVPPALFDRGRPDWGPPGPDAALLKGVGTGGRFQGKVGPGPGQVLVAATLLPQTSYLLARAAALVTDHGGLLSHGATQAREYGIPAVLGTHRATSVLGPGDEVLVDGERGAVYLLRRVKDSG